MDHNAELSPLMATSRARRALTAAKTMLCNNNTVDDCELHDIVTKCRLEYMRCVHKSAPVVMFQVISSFLDMKERCRYAVCSKSLYHEVVFGDGSATLIWRHSSNRDFWMACKNGALHVVEHMIQGGGINVNSTYWFGWTTLTYASKCNHHDVVVSLLRAKADVEVVDDLGCTPLMWSCICGHESVAQVLLEANSDVNVQDEKGYTPLMVACFNNCQAIVELLLEYNADVSIQDHDGQTAMLDRVQACV